MLKRNKTVLLVAAVLFMWTTAGYAGEIDVLLESMVDKGLLKPVEAQIIADRTKERVAKEIAEGRFTTLPKWIQNTTLNGNLRVRYQASKTKISTTPNPRHQGRLRYQLGIETRLNKNLKVAAGLTSGSDDPRSTNMTFTNGFERGDIRLDHAYAEWKPYKYAHLIAGQFPTDGYLWNTTDMLWDSDVNPQGAAIHLSAPFTRKWEGFFNAGAFIVDELSVKQDDPSMYYFQPGLSFENDSFDAKVAGIQYITNGFKGVRLDHSSCTNTGLTPVGSSCTGTLVDEYVAAGGSAEFGYNFFIGEEAKRIAVFGDYIRNSRFNAKNVGWAAGFQIGDKKISGFGDWQFRSQYTHLSKDAFPDFLPDSDRYSGETDVEGYELALKYGLAKNVYLGLDYYRDDKITGSSARKSTFQADINYKF